MQKLPAHERRIDARGARTPHNLAEEVAFQKRRVGGKSQKAPILAALMEEIISLVGEEEAERQIGQY